MTIDFSNLRPDDIHIKIDRRSFNADAVVVQCQPRCYQTVVDEIEQSASFHRIRYRISDGVITLFAHEVSARQMAEAIAQHYKDLGLVVDLQG